KPLENFPGRQPRFDEAQVRRPALPHDPRGKIMHSFVRRSSAVFWIVCLFAVSLFLSCIPGLAAEQGALHGAVTDPLGAIVPGAKVELLNGTTVVKTTTTDAAGNYRFDL